MAQRTEDPILADFRNFTFLLWKHLGLASPTPLQYDICDYLQRGPRRRIIQAFRGVGKSWITAAFVLWCLLKNPNERILVVSANKERAIQFTSFCKRLIAECPFLEKLRPEPGMRDSAMSFDVGGSMPHQSPSMRAAGITGQISGARASKIVGDDVEVPSNSLTQQMRDRLAEAVKEFDAILMSEADLRLVGVLTAEVIYLGTPQTEATLYRLLESRGYATRIWPARFPNEATNLLYAGRLAPMLEQMMLAKPELGTACHGRGAPTEAGRFPDLDLMERALSYGRSGWALQFMLNPILSDEERYPLKLSDLMVFDCDLKMGPIHLAWAQSNDLIRQDIPCVGLPGDRIYRPIFVSKENFNPYTGVVLAIDPSGRGKDELAYAVVAMLNGFLFLLKCRGLQGGYTDENLQHLANEAKKYGVTEVYVESNFGDGMFTKLLAPFLTRTHPCALEEGRSAGQKELRIIEYLEPVMNQHRLVVDASLMKEDQENYNQYSDEVAQRYQLFYQLTRITKDKGSLAQDDRLDALALAVQRWSLVMDRDTERNELEAREAARDADLQAFIDQFHKTHPDWGLPRDSVIAAEFGLYGDLA